MRREKKYNKKEKLIGVQAEKKTRRKRKKKTHWNPINAPFKSDIILINVKAIIKL